MVVVVGLLEELLGDGDRVAVLRETRRLRLLKMVRVRRHQRVVEFLDFCSGGGAGSVRRGGDGEEGRRASAAVHHELLHLRHAGSVSSRLHLYSLHTV